MKTNSQTTENKYFEFLKSVRLSGEINMFGAVPYLLDEFPELSKKEARDILLAWMKSPI